MFKKIILICLVWLFSFGTSFAENIPDVAAPEEPPKICNSNPQNKLNCSRFQIKTEDFSPGSKKILNKAQEGGGDTTKSAQAILGVIIKNLIVVFGVLSLLMMTIGGGMMIFHAGQESILTKGKGIFIWGAASLAIGLSAGVIVKIISYVLY